MRVIACLVVRDEADRYLDLVLEWTKRHITAEIAVWDDGSTDGTVGVAQAHGATVGLRPPLWPSFADDESRAREQAWRFMEDSFAPEPGDWIFPVDADEFLVAEPGVDEQEILADLDCLHDRDAVSLGRAEVFGFDVDGTPMIRLDGEWAVTSQVRLVRWQPGGMFHKKRLAGGSAPSYVDPAKSAPEPRLTILHYGYAHEGDRRIKHRRYMQHRGHSRHHIDSILNPRPRLRRWEGKIPALT